MSDDTGHKWDKKYLSKNSISSKPAEVLTSNIHLLPDSGAALDLACGPGGNAIVLASHGLNTSAWDISTVALSYLRETSKSMNLNINVEQRDVVLFPPEPDSFDVIVVSNFLDRGLMNAIVSALRPDGLVFYQTFTRERVRKPAPGNPDYKLDFNELLKLFSCLTVRYYREDGNTGNDEELQGMALIVAQKTDGQ